MRCNYLFFSILVLSGCGFSPSWDASTPARSPETVFQALAVAGVPYRWGGESPENGFDCSGLVAHVYREAFGIQLPHNALAQSRVGKRVSLGQLEAGDLVFYNTERRSYSHVGIYLGDDRFIHAPRPGAAVRVENMRIDYWVRRFDGARRIID
jgi:cell wall-associated NlpC family hydrolase